MPYGQETKCTSQTVRVAKSLLYFPDGNEGSITYTPTNEYCVIENSYTRSGGKNASMWAASKLPKYGGTFVEVCKTVYKGPRLPYKVWSKRLGKYVWARKPITVCRVVRQQTKSRPAKGMDLPPTPLYFEEIRNTLPSNSTIVGTKRGTNSIKYSGAIWAGFVPYNSGSSAVGPNTQQYFSGWPFSVLRDDVNALVKSADARASAKFYERLSKQKVNLAVALAERAQTASMFSKLVERLGRTLRALRKGDLLSAGRILFPGSSKEVANDWLLYQYGIKPLLADIQGVADALNDDTDFVFDIIGWVTEPVPTKRIFDLTRNAGIKCRTYVDSFGFVSVKYKVRCVVDSPSSRTLNELGFGNLAHSTWEAIPYSFIVDWITNVGEYLQARDAFTGVTVAHMHRTIFKKEYRMYTRAIGGVDSSGWSWPNQTFEGKSELTMCERTLGPLPSPPRLSFEDNLTKTKIANAVALLRQLIK